MISFGNKQRRDLLTVTVYFRLRLKIKISWIVFFPSTLLNIIKYTVFNRPIRRFLELILVRVRPVVHLVLTVNMRGRGGNCRKRLSSIRETELANSISIQGTCFVASPNLIAPAVWLEATTFRLAASYDNSVKRHSNAQTRARVERLDDWYSVSIIGCKRIAHVVLVKPRFVLAQVAQYIIR